MCSANGSTSISAKYASKVVVATLLRRNNASAAGDGLSSSSTHIEERRIFDTDGGRCSPDLSLVRRRFVAGVAGEAAAAAPRSSEAGHTNCSYFVCSGSGRSKIFVQFLRDFRCGRAERYMAARLSEVRQISRLAQDGRSVDGRPTMPYDEYVSLSGIYGGGGGSGGGGGDGDGGGAGGGGGVGGDGCIGGCGKTLLLQPSFDGIAVRRIICSASGAAGCGLQVPLVLLLVTAGCNSTGNPTKMLSNALHSDVSSLAVEGWRCDSGAHHPSGLPTTIDAMVVVSRIIVYRLVRCTVGTAADNRPIASIQLAWHILWLRSSSPVGRWKMFT